MLEVAVCNHCYFNLSKLAERDHLRNVRKTQEEEMQQRQAEILAIKTG